MELYEITKLLHNKRNGHQIEEGAHRMGEKSLPTIHLTNQNIQRSQKTKLPKNK
jgi:hypothetical protein